MVGGSFNRQILCSVRFFYVVENSRALSTETLPLAPADAPKFGDEL